MASSSETEMEERLTIKTKNRRKRSPSRNGRASSVDADKEAGNRLLRAPQAIHVRKMLGQSGAEAGLVESPPSGTRISTPGIVSVKESELMRRRRQDAVIGMEETQIEESGHGR